jgi:hypothetical protein
MIFVSSRDIGGGLVPECDELESEPDETVRDDEPDDIGGVAGVVAGVVWNGTG